MESELQCLTEFLVSEKQVFLTDSVAVGIHAEEAPQAATRITTTWRYTVYASSISLFLSLPLPPSTSLLGVGVVFWRLFNNFPQLANMNCYSDHSQTSTCILTWTVTYFKKYRESERTMFSKNLEWKSHARLTFRERKCYADAMIGESWVGIFRNRLNVLHQLFDFLTIAAVNWF